MKKIKTEENKAVKKGGLAILLLTSTFALAFAYVLQFVFDYQPCILCLYERLPFFIIIAFSAIGLVIFSSDKFVKVVVLCCVILLAINIGISLYHVAVEQEVIAGPTVCESSSNLNAANNVNDLKAELLKTKAVRCDEPQLSFLKLSLAAWNAVYCLLLVFFCWYNRKLWTKGLRTVDKK